MPKLKYYALADGMYYMPTGADSQVEWPIMLATTLPAMIPTLLVAIHMQRQIVSGMTDTEK